MATRKAPGTRPDSEIGSIEPGKQPDLILIERDRPHLARIATWSTLAFAAQALMCE
jgi:cytosine/adenosine deaminase-related metal-dependent hydrolase